MSDTDVQDELEVDDEEELEEGEENEEGADGDDDGEEEPVTVEAIVAQIADSVQSTVDQRIGSLMNTLRKDYGLTKKGQTPPPPGKKSDPPADTSLRLRFLKSAVAEELGDQEFSNKEERRQARALAFRLAEGHVHSDQDEYEIAGEIVTEVMGVVSKLKDTYQKQLRRDLKRRGALRDEDEGQPGNRKPKPGQESQKAWDKGAELAQRKFGKKDDTEQEVK